MKETSQTNSNDAPKGHQSAIGWYIVFMGGLFYLYQFMLRVSPNIMSDEIMEVLAIDAAAFGFIVGVYYWGYTAMQLPLGIMMDRIGPRFFLCAAALLCSLSSFIFGHTSTPYIAGIARFLMGTGSACGLIGTIKLGSIWLEPKHIAKVTAMAILMGTAGAGLGGTPLNYVLDTYGYAHTMEVMGVLGIVIAAIIFLSVRTHPPINHQSELPNLYENSHPVADLMQLAKSPQAWVVAVYGMLMYVPITVMGIAWGVSFVERACDTTEGTAASVVSTMFLGAAIGSPIFAFFSDSIKSRRWPMLVGSILTSIVWFTIFLNHQVSLQFMYVLFFIAGFAYTSKCLTFASICEIMPKNISGTSIAFVNMIVMTTGIIFHPLIGSLLDSRWNGTVIDKIRYYSEADYRYALMVIPICLAVSGFLIFFMRESHPESSIVKEYGSLIDRDVL